MLRWVFRSLVAIMGMRVVVVEGAPGNEEVYMGCLGNLTSTRWVGNFFQAGW